MGWEIRKLKTGRDRTSFLKIAKNRNKKIKRGPKILRMKR